MGVEPQYHGRVEGVLFVLHVFGSVVAYWAVAVAENRASTATATIRWKSFK